MAKVLMVVGLILYHGFIIGSLSSGKYKKVCQGTSNGLSYTRAESEARYRSFRERYEGCVSVDGNLEITNFGNENESFSFLASIEEVSGYVLIATNYVDRIPLTSLRIIRGRTLFLGLDYPQDAVDRNRTRNYSLYVTYNYRDRGEGAVDGLSYLSMPNLTEISMGSVLFHSNARLCFVETIDWTDILSGEGAKTTFAGPNPDYNGSHCGKCNNKCPKVGNRTTRQCWTKKYCQTLTRVVCAAQCSGRCFGTAPNQCCHTECAAGCTGPQDSDCHSCKNFVDEGRCVPFCPQPTYYDPIEFVNKPNPNAKYAYGSQCYEECPLHMMVSKGACVSDCGKGHYADENRTCVQCASTCPIRCLGTLDTDWVNAKNIKSFENCTLVQGSLKIQESTFDGDPARNISGLSVSDLSALENIVEITGYLRVDSNLEELRSLSFLRNLRIIQGRSLDRGVSALRIIHTKMESLGLDSLREVRNGKILISWNSRLCFAESFNWTKLLVHPDQTAVVTTNRNGTECVESGLVCAAQCTGDGCMGPLNDQCFNCSNFRFGTKCLSTCADHFNPHLTPISKTSRECTPCHANCQDSCQGPDDDQCDSCRYRRLGRRCIADCPKGTYEEDGVCHPCSPSCERECFGPDNVRSPTGCKSCRRYVYWKDESYPKCLLENEDCPQDYYKSQGNDCKHCHDECRNCSNYGADMCHECRNFKQEKSCVPSCSADHYANDSLCLHCHEECLGCHGPTEADCNTCRVYTLYDNFEPRSTKFVCTKACPENAANKLREGNRTICVSDEHVAPDRKKLVAIIAGTICGGIFFLGLGVAILILRRQVARAEEKKIRLTAKMSGIVECEPLTPSNAKPDMAVLRLIRESDIRRSGIIGSGAFGTVYKGLWVPEGENVKIPVAIKVLQDGAGENANILEEARIMASVVHPSCLHVLAVCLAAQVMLVTQLMPLGCLLDYVRKHRENIGSKVVLNWCTQIARGMGYLEERGIIHRDLAARNVLVHSPSHVKITDFGLAKLVDEDGQFHSTGGKLPIKWLALECIRSRVFTHKSDVWSFGVTVWELCTYGQRPYENVNASDIVSLLEKGERLPQPSICTIDVYMIMIKCWMLSAESRPSFAELAEEFAKMARDPGRYLVIPNDKLMRLPSQPADFQELLRNVSLTLDGPEEVIMADKYVNEHSKKSRRKRPDKAQLRSDRQTPMDEEDGGKQPPQNTEPSIQGRRPHDPSKNPDASGQQPSSSTSSSSSSKSPSSRVHPVPRLELVPQPPNLLLSSGGGGGGGGSDDGCPRYSPDPCSLSYHPAFPEEGGPVDGSTVPAGSPSSVGGGGGGGKRPVAATESYRLALDGSDYLQPRSSAMVPVSYLELVDYSATDEVYQDDSRNDQGREETEKRSPFLSKTPSSVIENPEYFQPTTTATTTTTTAAPILVAQVP